MSRFYTKRQYDSIVNVFEFKTSSTTTAVMSVGNPSRKQPLTQIRHDWMEKNGWTRIAGVNLSFFDMSGTKPLFYGVDFRDGGFTHVSPAQTNFEAYELGMKNGKLYIGDMTETYFRNEFEGKGGNWVCSLSYSLILNGKIDIQATRGFSHYKERHPRTCVGEKADGTIVLCVIDGRSKKSKGVTAYESAKIMLDLGCIKAINADGGGSSQMIYRDKLINEYPGPYVRPVSNALLVYTKDTLKVETPKSYPVLSLWAKGDYVRIMQNALIRKGYPLGVHGADGSFGPATLKILKQFQRENGLVVDGFCGPATWGKLL